MAALGVARQVDRQQLVLAESRAFLEHGIDQFGRRLLEARQAGHGGLVVEDLVEQIADVL